MKILYPAPDFFAVRPPQVDVFFVTLQGLRAVAPLLRLLDSESHQEAAFEALVHLGSAAVPALCQQVGVLGRAPREGARLLAHIGDPVCLDCLLDLLVHSDADVRRSAAEALGSLSTRYPHLALKPLAGTLGHFDQLVGVGDDRMDSRFQRLLTSRDGDLRAAASRALGQPPPIPNTKRRATPPKLRVRTRGRAPRLDRSLG